MAYFCGSRGTASSADAYSPPCSHLSGLMRLHVDTVTPCCFMRGAYLQNSHGCYGDLPVCLWGCLVCLCTLMHMPMHIYAYV